MKILQTSTEKNENATREPKILETTAARHQNTQKIQNCMKFTDTDGTERKRNARAENTRNDRGAK